MRWGLGFIILTAAACSGSDSARPAATPPRAAPIASPLPTGPVDAGEPLSVSPSLAAEVVSEEELMADVQWLCEPARAGRGAYQPGGRATARWLADRFTAVGLQVSLHSVPGGAVNVVGRLSGDEQAIIVAAHYDHLGTDDRGVLYPGADDNASGLAGLLAVTRVLSQYAGGHTVLFVAFGAEELGLVGSAAWVADPPWPLERTLAMVNFDMIGRNFFELVGGKPGAVAVIGLETSARNRRAVQAAAAAEGLELFRVSAGLISTIGMDARTDDWWFRERGIPTIHFSTGMHRDYHQPSDTPDKLRPAQMRSIVRTATRTIIELAELSAPEALP